MPTTAHGACLCQAVQFEIDMPTNWCANCYCSMCRRAHGAGFVTWVSVASDRFRITAGQQELKRFASSEEAVRSFCGQCGSPLTFQSKRWSGEVHVARAAIADELDHDGPQAHAFVDDRASWAHLCGDGLPRLGGTTGTEPTNDERKTPARGK